MSAEPSLLAQREVRAVETRMSTTSSKQTSSLLSLAARYRNIPSCPESLGTRRMRVRCGGCGGWHALSPTAMAVVIRAFQDGDLQEVTKDGVVPLCLHDAFTEDTMTEWSKRLDRKTVVTIDNQKWSKAA